jgi:lysophospholipase L1-like esterase
MKGNMAKSMAVAAALCGCATIPVGSVGFRSGDKVAFLGDSITEWGATNRDGSVNPTGYVNLVLAAIRANGANVEGIYAGVAGNLSVQMLKRFDHDILSRKPDWMFLSCGVNDAPNGYEDERKNPGIPLEDYKQNITALLDRAKAHGIKVIVMTATPVVEEPEHQANANLVPYNAFLRDIAAARSLPLVDQNAAFNSYIDGKRDKAVRELTVDGTHMSEIGNKLMAETIRAALGL